MEYVLPVYKTSKSYIHKQKIHHFQRQRYPPQKYCYLTFKTICHYLALKPSEPNNYLWKIYHFEWVVSCRPLERVHIDIGGCCKRDQDCL